MSELPRNVAGTPRLPKAVEGDELSEVLGAIRLRGGDVVRAVGGDTSGSVRYPTGSRMLHLVEDGDLFLAFAAPGGVRLNPGDLAVLARGEAHEVRGGDSARWVTGHFNVESKVAEALLRELPPVIVIRDGGQDTGLLLLSRELMLAEIGTPRPGSRVVLSRILDLLLIHALRSWRVRGEPRPGWLSATLDETLGPVISAIHRSPDRRWTVIELAARAGLSRSAFASRFTTVLGEPPGRYLALLRLHRAADLLTTTTTPVSAVARKVGYDSEAAFSRAFRREFGYSPRGWRDGVRADAPREPG